MNFLVRATAFSFFVFLAMVFGKTQAQTIDAGSRVALVFGNAAYSAPDRPLKNPVSDARLMARTLRELGFDVRLREDVDRRAMLQAFRELEDTLRKTKGVGFVYFAGHGVQVNGRNYIVPIGANLVRDVDAQRNAIDADAVLQSLRDTGAKLNILVLDACRNNPLLATSRGGGGTSAKTGLAPMRPPEGALVAFATEPGRLASDGKETGNGLYTRHLAKWIKEPDLTLEQVFKRTREAVQLESKGEQIPTEYSVLTGADLYLGGITANGSNSGRLAGSAGSAISQQAPLLKNAIAGSVLASRSAAPVAQPAPQPDVSSARARLAQLGAGYTKQSYQLALDNDDLPVFELLVASGWKVETWDVVRLLDPREMPPSWPKKIMTAIAANGRKSPLGEELCDAAQMKKRFGNVVDILKRGYDSAEMDGSRMIWERDYLNRSLAPRRDFYRQLCGSAALAKN